MRKTVDGCALDCGDFMLAQAFANDVQPQCQGRIAKRPLPLPRERRVDCRGERLLRIDDLGLGLGQRRRVPILLLERCMARFLSENVKADGARLRAFGADAMTRGLPGILRHQGLQLGL